MASPSIIKTEDEGDVDRTLCGSQISLVNNLVAKASLQSFCYSSLPTASFSIRLLRVEPTLDKEGIIQCSFQTCDLSETKANEYGRRPRQGYAALSYTWEPKLPLQKILVDGKDMLIGYNLWCFLNRIRDGLPERRLRWLWIDAININQEDYAEKSSQVAGMDLIYQSASELYVWLGEGTHASDMVFDILGRLNPSDIPTLQDSVAQQFSCKVFDQTMVPKTFKAIEHVLQRTYWSRRWVWQELAFRPENEEQTLILCGERSLKLWQWRKLFSSPLCQLPEDDIADTVVFIPDDRDDQEADLIRARHRIGKAASSIPEILSQSHQIYLHDLVPTDDTRECSLSLDRVFALWNMCIEGALFPPDYSTSSIDLFWRLISFHVLDSGSPHGDICMNLEYCCNTANALLTTWQDDVEFAEGFWNCKSLETRKTFPLIHKYNTVQMVISAARDRSMKADANSLCMKTIFLYRSDTAPAIKRHHQSTARQQHIQLRELYAPESVGVEIPRPGDIILSLTSGVRWLLRQHPDKPSQYLGCYPIVQKPPRAFMRERITNHQPDGLQRLFNHHLHIGVDLTEHQKTISTSRPSPETLWRSCPEFKVELNKAAFLALVFASRANRQTMQHIRTLQPWPPRSLYRFTDN